MTGFLNGILGGALIGLAVSLMLFFYGRVTGISGLTHGALFPGDQENSKQLKITFLLGLIIGGAVMYRYRPELFVDMTTNSTFHYALGGLLVGLGTMIGNGCTSGHGVCGLSRLSKRSIVATITFIMTAVLTVYLQPGLENIF